MEIILSHNKTAYTADLTRPLDISILLGQVKCFYAPDVKMTPYRSGDFIGSVKKGAPVNFYNVELNPHGNGTHTECLGHITRKQESVSKQLKQYHHLAQLVTVELSPKGKADKVISLKNLKAACPSQLPPALIIRTSPNPKAKLTRDYSGTNPPYLAKTAMKYLVAQGVEHLLLDLPSVDREVDKGVLAAHHIFWDVAEGKKQSNKRTHCTITEMIFIDNKIKDGLYLLNLQLAPLDLDASPSRPILYKLKQTKS